jgi:atypical dual specificity phosphatase
VPDGLSLHCLGLAREGRWLLRGLTLDLPAAGIVRLHGPPCGVDALGRVVARHVLPSTQVWGSVTLGGIDLRVVPPAALVSEESAARDGDVASMILARAAAPVLMQLFGAGEETSSGRASAYVSRVLHEHLLGELAPSTLLSTLRPPARLHLELAAASTTGAKVIWVTSSVAAFSDVELGPVLRTLRKLSATALVVLAGAADELAARMDASEVCLPEVPEHLALAAEDPLAPRGLPGFRWIVPGQLAGMARPGSGLQLLDEDLAALAALEVAALVTLEETHVHQRELTSAGVEAWHLPMPDMGTPAPDAARDVSLAAARLMDRGRLVVFHCRGGVGRTGTLLACTLITRGHSAAHALELLRQINPYYVQSQEQLAFLHAFSKEHHGRA